MINELTASLNVIVTQTQNNLKILGVILLIPWSIFFISHFISNKILLFGIIPRHILGLPGILLAPLLHANFNHLFFNSIPLLVLSNFILINGVNYYLIVTMMITIFSGTLIWCFAKRGIHIGASGLITGYWGFLVYNIYQTGTLTTIILGLLSLYYFAGIFLGIFPGEKGVSWQGHLFGLLAGFLTSYLLEIYPGLLLII
ncbi:rhomboid family intramembrane serine protease [Legionella pneumophila]|uniref:rhomboid family intramembrane serine protease n=1 Tax=Legionella pneumophila TaxID=446 RepID=UPI0010128D0E|nr:rhomboid family intramembrane serine protease [Legionella pneumophila]HAT8825282.1 rhomboid family intramembrane serine protease [Legionella pneumophila subsp. pneumophila]MCW8437135.1 rhomboid family intramembrane serine protease [Legionella pneumophila]MCW8476439.1 rhomboid family intramembrane serine protease [Legionella pneumophila]MCW8479488.1 rhomboid family intramembrane serine protease [Legionella pneumophila]MCW8491034.1 rhomboid family intramembrane serine protease [Legionella pne